MPYPLYFVYLDFLSVDVCSVVNSSVLDCREFAHFVKALCHRLFVSRYLCGRKYVIDILDVAELICSVHASVVNVGIASHRVIVS